MGGILTLPQVGIEKKGNIYFTCSKPLKDYNGDEHTFIRLGVCTEASVYDKYDYAVRAFINCFDSSLNKNDNSIRYIYAPVREYYTYIYAKQIQHKLIKTNRLNNTFINLRHASSDSVMYYPWQSDLAVKFKVLTGFILSYDEPKTYFENAFAHHIARLCDKTTSHHLIGQYAVRCSEAAYIQVYQWFENRNIQTIEQFLEYMNNFSSDCETTFDQYRFA